jgi:hypothetical protein
MTIFFILLGVFIVFVSFSISGDKGANIMILGFVISALSWAIGKQFTE